MPVSPALSDASIKYPPRMLAEAVRALLDDSPSDDLPGQPVGTLTVQRAWLPIYQLEDQTANVITVIAGDDNGERYARNGLNSLDIDCLISVQRLLQTQDQNSNDWKQEIDDLVDYAQRVLIAAYTDIIDDNGKTYTPISFERTFDDDALRNLSQAAVLIAITYRSVQ